MCVSVRHLRGGVIIEGRFFFVLCNMILMGNDDLDSQHLDDQHKTIFRQKAIYFTRFLASLGILLTVLTHTKPIASLCGKILSIYQFFFFKLKTFPEPVVKVPNENERFVPQFLPDPRHGSLYMFGTHSGQRHVLKKLPFTIPQLVANAPCRSSDGILYTGKKIDTWFMIDPKTGIRKHILGRYQIFFNKSNFMKLRRKLIFFSMSNICHFKKKMHLFFYFILRFGKIILLFPYYTFFTYDTSILILPFLNISLSFQKIRMVQILN